MADRSDAARYLLDDAFNDVVDPKVPLERAIRKSIRIANLLGHVHDLWSLRYELTDFRDVATEDSKTLRRKLSDQYTDLPVDDIIMQAMTAYMTRRKTAVLDEGIPDSKVFVLPVSGIEELRSETAAGSRSLSPAQRQAVDKIILFYDRLLRSTRNFVQDYLMQVERTTAGN